MNLFLVIFIFFNFVHISSISKKNKWVTVKKQNTIHLKFNKKRNIKKSKKNRKQRILKNSQINQNSYQVSDVTLSHLTTITTGMLIAYSPQIIIITAGALTEFISQKILVTTIISYFEATIIGTSLVKAGAFISLQAIGFFTMPYLAPITMGAGASYILYNVYYAIDQV